MNPTTSAGALTQLQQAQQAAQDPNSYLTQQKQQLGVNSAQDTVNGLRTSIDNTTKLLKQVAPSVMGRTASSLVTDAQAQKQIQNEQAPITTNLTDETNQYNEANSDLGNLETQAEQAATGEYQGQQDKLSYLQNLYNSLYGQENDAANRAEQAREANLSAKSSAANPGIDPSILAALIGGSSSVSSAPTTLTGGKTKEDAQTAITNLLGTKNKNLINTTASAIKKSAGYGNTYDQAKLELLQAAGYNV